MVKRHIQVSLLLPVFWLLLIATASADNTLVIQVKTDMEPVREFTGIRVVISSLSSGRHIKTIIYQANKSTNPAGIRVAELHHLPNEELTLRVMIFNHSRLLAERPVQISTFHGVYVVTMLLVRPDDQFSVIRPKNMCLSAFNKQIQSCSATARRCLLSGHGHCDARRLACEAQARKDRKSCDAKVKKTSLRRKKELYSLNVRGNHFISRLPKKTVQHVRVKKRSPGRYAHHAPFGAIRIGGINYIARKSASRQRPARISQRGPNRIVIAGINYLARKNQ